MKTGTVRGSGGPKARLRWAAAAVAACAVLAACAGPADQASSGGTPADAAAAKQVVDKYTAAPATITQTTGLTGPVPTGKKIVFANSGLPATQLIAGGVQEAAAALGYGYQSVSYDSGNPATLQAALRTALASKPDAVIIAGNAPATFGEATLQAYRDAGVPLVVGSVCPNDAKAPVVAGAAGCELEEATGRAFADWFIADSGGKGKALFTNVKAIPSLAAFVNAFSAESSAKCAECKVDILEATLNQVSENQIVQSAVNKLRTDPSYNYLFFDNAQWSKGILPALKAAGRQDVKVGGRSLDEGALNALHDGTESAWTALAYNVIGYGNMDAALRAIAKEPPAVVVPPFQIVTPQNAKDITAPYRYPTDALKQYLQLWKVG
ncbi:sugar ABC transporter substrate-binding protein [Saccharopolyspora spinosa]|uniref:Ribose transport system substrate-binding protein n=1 Tax=Saccharopolyspora spinosa TaxID=60894 RepID=A0A2N3Y6K3_SACSN|nr:substrate-binding domain-containing protein [Saccharopolyspora spinosa]PKW18566.1 ribose transport system substrate-binding protein [Saccharopolyspora spinosa]